jgi:hypothetical protein
MAVFMSVIAASASSASTSTWNCASTARHALLCNAIARFPLTLP